MCLAIPGKLVACFEANSIRMGRMDFGGVWREVCLEYLADLEVGDYAIVHAGFAISRVDQQAAQETLQELTRLGMVEGANE